jgi:hypothetical protein
MTVRQFVLQTGIHAGKSLERLMFTDPRYVSLLAQAGNRYAAWLIQQGEDRIGPSCTSCGQEGAQFLVFYQSSDGDFTIFPGAYCQRCAIDHKSCGRIMKPLAFSTARWPRRKVDQARIAKHIAGAFGLRRASDERLFRFFSAKGSTFPEWKVPLFPDV